MQGQLFTLLQGSLLMPFIIPFIKRLMNSRYMEYLPVPTGEINQCNLRSRFLVVSNWKVHLNVQQDKKKLFARMKCLLWLKHVNLNECVRYKVPGNHSKILNFIKSNKKQANKCGHIKRLLSDLPIFPKGIISAWNACSYPWYIWYSIGREG